MNRLASPLRPFALRNRASHLWARLGLDGRYAVASLPVLVVAMLWLGAWVTQSIEDEVVDNAGINASLFVNSVVSPELQGMAVRPQLTQDEARRLGELLTATQLGRHILSFKVWAPGGRIVYYNRGPIPDRAFEPGRKLREAWRGRVAAELSSLDEAESSPEHALGVPLLEVYMPVHARGTERVVAVAEFYQDARKLEGQVAQTRSRTWAMVALVMLTMYGLLFAIVHAGGRLIRSQASQLREKVAELSELLAQNEALRARVGRATRRITEMNEAFLRRLSADLHDGPAQAVGLALLRLDHVANPAGAHEVQGTRVGEATVGRTLGELDQIRNTLQEAMREIRQVCRGLSLPELADMDVGEVVERAAASHQRRTRTDVDFDIQGLDGVDAAMPIKMTAYRFTQEALMNAFRHAHGMGQEVTARRVGNTLELRVSDRGPGMAGELVDVAPGDRMGLSGLRERVEVLGGRFQIETAPARGTTLQAILPLE